MLCEYDAAADDSGSLGEELGKEASGDPSILRGSAGPDIDRLHGVNGVGSRC